MDLLNSRTASKAIEIPKFLGCWRFSCAPNTVHTHSILFPGSSTKVVLGDISVEEWSHYVVLDLRDPLASAS